MGHCGALRGEEVHALLWTRVPPPGLLREGQDGGDPRTQKEVPAEWLADPLLERPQAPRLSRLAPRGPAAGEVGGSRTMAQGAFPPVFSILPPSRKNAPLNAKLGNKQFTWDSSDAMAQKRKGL